MSSRLGFRGFGVSGFRGSGIWGIGLRIQGFKCKITPASLHKLRVEGGGLLSERVGFTV